ncbi:flagellar hook-basal body complex protein [Ornithinibacillus halophilus]|uniref:Flagellar hook protein FlgE n=1 Tax=Ornithinibacillus halophilus TaxID=930117 RepID=A0A1M5CAC1_9BACI|nr:flagellar hook-basal body complex protein [Ornithinibacillus halophilus]SHF51703.1 flagellar hook protein FlgE [Ornithinibacillus halophilus]
MLRSMYAGISGMKNFQTKLDVIGNNIANVNTAGFKKGRVTFQDMMSQTMSGAQGPTQARGGVNPSQVGLGSQLGTIDNIHTQGFRQTTYNPLDFALEGDGMFALQNGEGIAFTRAGNFYLDQNGTIVNPDGLYLLGFGLESTTLNTTLSNEATIEITELVETGEVIVNYSKDDVTESYTISLDSNERVFNSEDGDTTIEFDESGTPTFTVGGNVEELELQSTTLTDSYGTEPTQLSIPDTAQSFNVQTNGIINYVDENGDTQVAGKVALANFSNPAGLQKAGSNLFLDSENAGFTGFVAPETSGAASIVSGALEMSNVDLSEEFTEMITAQRAFQANTRIITTSDEILQELVNLKR